VLLDELLGIIDAVKQLTLAVVACNEKRTGVSKACLRRSLIRGEKLRILCVSFVVCLCNIVFQLELIL
jgi:hypothetical protein